MSVWWIRVKDNVEVRLTSKWRPETSFPATPKGRWTLSTEHLYRYTH
jgi:hypothetical protein